MVLNVTLDSHEDTGDDQVPDRSGDEQGDRLEEFLSFLVSHEGQFQGVGMALTREVVLSIEIVSFPMGGTITRIA